MFNLTKFYRLSFLLFYHLFSYGMDSVRSQGLLSLVSKDAETQDGSALHYGDNSCVACIETLSEGLTTTLSCGHTLHHSCFMRCMSQNRKCPTCRAEVKDETFFLPAEVLPDLNLAYQSLRKERKELSGIEDLLLLMRREGVDESYKDICKSRKEVGELVLEIQRLEAEIIQTHNKNMSLKEEFIDRVENRMNYRSSAPGRGFLASNF